MLRLRAEQIKKGLSQNRLAAEAKITPADLSKIANGRMVPYPVQLTKIAAALGWPADRAQELLEHVPVEEAAALAK